MLQANFDGIQKNSKKDIKKNSILWQSYTMYVRNDSEEKKKSTENFNDLICMTKFFLICIHKDLKKNRRKKNSLT